MCITSVENIPVGGFFRLTPDGYLYECGRPSSDGFVLCVRDCKSKSRRNVEVPASRRVIFYEQGDNV